MNPFGDLLKEWRRVRRMSQLDLATTADVSQRHVSFLETGRSAPSREMVLHLAAALDVPLRDRNGLLTAAGFSAAYEERRLDGPELEGIRHVLEVVLRSHEPFPAYVIDRSWDLILANEAAGTVVGALVDPSDAPRFAGNLLRLAFHPRGLRNSLANWDEAAIALLDRLEREVEERPLDPVLAELSREIHEYPGIAELADRRPASLHPELLVPLRLRIGADELSLFTTIATIGAPYDVTLEELRIESLLPADDRSEKALRRVVTGSV